MAAWALPLLLVAVAGGTALAANNSKKKKGTGGGGKPQPLPAPPGGPGKTYTIDVDMPPAMEDQVLAALVQEQDPNKLEAFAASIASVFPLSAAALRSKATALRAHVFVLPPNPLDFLATVPDPPRSQVAQMVLQINDPNELEGVAVQFDATLPMAAIALRAKAALLRAGMTPQGPSPQQPPPAPQPQPQPRPPHHLPPEPPPPIPVQPQPLPQPVPVPLPIPVPFPQMPGPVPAPIPIPIPMQPAPPQPIPQQPPPVPPIPGLPSGVPFTLDSGMPPEMQKAVLGALTTESDPAKLQGFATSIQGQYPIAAGLLAAKANALLLARGQVPGVVQPPSPPPPVPSPAPSPAPAPPPPATPIFPLGLLATHSGRNTGRLTGKYPFAVLGTSGPGNAPITIAKTATGDETNWTQLRDLNPQAHLGVSAEFVGQALNVPWDWAFALRDAGYVIQQDEGASPPPNLNLSAHLALPARAPAALLPGGPHVAHA